MLYVAAVASLAMFGEIHKDKDYPAFERFIRAHRNGLPYKDELETLGRFATFKANLVKIEERNKKGQEKHGVTKFADLTRDEFLSKFTGAQPASEELKKKVAKLDPTSLQLFGHGEIDRLECQGRADADQEPGPMRQLLGVLRDRAA